MQRGLETEIKETKRDHDTGVALGAEARVFEGDNKKACLLIHGWASSPIDFNDLGEKLHKEGYTVRIMLLPGHGTTPRDLEQKSVNDFLGAVKAEFLAMKLSFDEVNVIGFSMGGSLAVLLASMEDVDRLVLVAPFFRITYRFFYILPAELWNTIISPFVSYVMISTKYLQAKRDEAKEFIYTYKHVPTKSVKDLCELGRLARDQATLEKITCPVLLIHSNGDMAASSAASEDAFLLIGSSDKELILYDKSNHHILWDHDRNEAMKHISVFITKDK